jgi:hypothetical protein
MSVAGKKTRLQQWWKILYLLAQLIRELIFVI